MAVMYRRGKSGIKSGIHHAPIKSPYSETKQNLSRKTIKKAKSADFSKVVWVSSVVMSAISSGLEAAQVANNQKNEYKNASLLSRNQAQSDFLNAQLTASNKVLDLRSQEQEAAHKAMLDGVAMAETRSQMAASGVLMTSGSKREVQASQKFLHDVGLINADLNKTNTGLAYDREQTNYLASQQLHLGEAKANDILADSINPTLVGIFSGLSSAIGSVSSSFSGN